MARTISRNKSPQITDVDDHATNIMRPTYTLNVHPYLQRGSLHCSHSCQSAMMATSSNKLQSVNITVEDQLYACHSITAFVTDKKLRSSKPYETRWSSEVCSVHLSASSTWPPKDTGSHTHSGRIQCPRGIIHRSRNFHSGCVTATVKPRSCHAHPATSHHQCLLGPWRPPILLTPSFISTPSTRMRTRRRSQSRCCLGGARRA